ncbi:hypothetical protein NL676_024065 [Syzygium grande]|nr:hypothetical protein NL676_024065 [Syzygium grande]
MKITVMTADEQIISLDIDPHESVENVKALLGTEDESRDAVAPAERIDGEMEFAREVGLGAKTSTWVVTARTKAKGHHGHSKEADEKPTGTEPEPGCPKQSIAPKSRNCQPRRLEFINARDPERTKNLKRGEKNGEGRPNFAPVEKARAGCV